MPAQSASDTVADLRKLSVITAIKTPYLKDGKFDLESYDAMVQRQIDAGVGGLIIGGTTGEGHLMSWDEHIMLIAHTVNTFGRAGFQVGMHASLQINPYYGKTSVTGLLGHFKAVLDEGPAIVYNVPGRTGQDIPDDVILELAQHPLFLGVKECTGNARIGGYHAKGVRCWSGNDDEAHAARHDFHALGAISVASNLVPGLVVRLMAGRDDATAASLHSLMAWLFCEPNPIPLDTALAMCGLVKPVFRLPYVPLRRALSFRFGVRQQRKEERAKGLPLLQALQEHLPGVEDIRVMEDSEFQLISRWY
eukprot:scaffold23.g4116.t1